ncbi:hypothetical protein AB0M58_37805 [Streptomyces bobili]|uniref:hypothetical protein n=1 Tax=Streptomyces bobili TaxID=67280 RepID=UPI00341B0E0E
MAPQGAGQGDPEALGYGKTAWGFLAALPGYARRPYRQRTHPASAHTPAPLCRHHRRERRAGSVVRAGLWR